MRGAKRSASWKRAFTDRWLTGADIAVVALEFGINENVARSWRRRLKLPERRKIMSYSPADIELAAKLRASGLLWAEIGRQMNQDPAGLRQAVQRRGLCPPPVRREVQLVYACPRCGARSTEIGGHGICTPLPMMQGVDRRAS